MVELNGVSMDGVIFAAIVGVFLLTLVYLEVQAWREDTTGRGFAKTMLRKAEEQMEE